jgi:hypothetical protein
MIGPIRIQIVPSRRKKKNPVKSEKQKKHPKDFLTRLKQLPRPRIRDLMSAWRALRPATKRAFKRLIHGICINPLTLSIIFAGQNDPAGAAERYGYANGLLWTGMPALEQLVKIPAPSIHLDVDYQRERTEVRGATGLSIRIGTLLAIAFEIGFPLMIWFLKFHRETKKRQKEEQRKLQHEPAEHPAV